MRNLRNALRRVQKQQAETATRGEERHHQIDEQFGQAWQLAQELTGRLAQVESNTARIDALVTAFAEHMNDKKAHK